MKFATYIALVGISNQINIKQTGTTTAAGPEGCNMVTPNDTQCPKLDKA